MVDSRSYLLIRLPVDILSISMCALKTEHPLSMTCSM